MTASAERDFIMEISPVTGAPHGALFAAVGKYGALSPMDSPADRQF
jgi:hypothetical protein